MSVASCRGAQFVALRQDRPRCVIRCRRSVSWRLADGEMTAPVLPYRAATAAVLLAGAERGGRTSTAEEKMSAASHSPVQPDCAIPLLYAVRI